MLPSLFEGGGFPVVEAFFEGTPLACSTATSLPEYAGDAALLFEPSVDGIGAALRRLATDEKLRSELEQKGLEQRARFSWERAALAYRTLYRAAAGRPVEPSEFALLEEPF